VVISDLQGIVAVFAIVLVTFRPSPPWGMDR
jgi:hypothetical protein